jgi:hypothetical protein
MRLLGIASPVSAQPFSVAWITGGGKCNVGWGQRFGCVSALLDEVQQVACMRAADEGTLRTAIAQGIGQRQAAHDVASADLQRGVGAEGDFQRSTFVDKCFFFFIKYLGRYTLVSISIKDS